MTNNTPTYHGLRCATCGRDFDEKDVNAEVSERFMPDVVAHGGAMLYEDESDLNKAAMAAKWFVPGPTCPQCREAMAAVSDYVGHGEVVTSAEIAERSVADMGVPLKTFQGEAPKGFPVDRFEAETVELKDQAPIDLDPPAEGRPIGITWEAKSPNHFRAEVTDRNIPHMSDVWEIFRHRGSEWHVASPFGSESHATLREAMDAVSDYVNDHANVVGPVHVNAAELTDEGRVNLEEEIARTTYRKGGPNGTCANCGRRKHDHTNRVLCPRGGSKPKEEPVPAKSGISITMGPPRGPMVHHEFGETAREQAERLHREHVAKHNKE